MTIPDSRSADGGARPAICPFCHGKAVDTRATIVTVTTYWRCLECDRTWTIPSCAAVPARSPTRGPSRERSGPPWC
jgi:hypothetical protein